MFSTGRACDLWRQAFEVWHAGVHDEHRAGAVPEIVPVAPVVVVILVFLVMASGASRSTNTGLLSDLTTCGGHIFGLQNLHPRFKSGRRLHFLIWGLRPQTPSAAARGAPSPHSAPAGSLASLARDPVGDIQISDEGFSEP